MAARTEGLSACTASSETFQLNAGCSLEGRRGLQDEPAQGEFLAEESQREEWVNWEDLEELGIYTEIFLGQVRDSMLLIAVCF